MPSSNVVWDIDESVGTLTFNRPHARNALTGHVRRARRDLRASRRDVEPESARGFAEPARPLPPAPTFRSSATSNQAKTALRTSAASTPPSIVSNA